MKRALLMLVALLLPHVALAQVSPPPVRVQNAGTNLPIRFKINCTGSLTCSDDAANGRTQFSATGANLGNYTFSGSTFNLPANALFTGASSATNTTALTITPNVADGASSIAFLLNNATTLSTAGSLLLSLQNNGTQKFAVGPGGQMNWYGSITVPGGAIDVASAGAALNSIATYTLKAPTGSAVAVNLSHTNTAGGQGVLFGVANNMTTAGNTALAFNPGGRTVNLVVASGDVNYTGYVAQSLVADTSGTTANKVVVWSSNLKVQIPAATANWKTVAGVALATVSNGASVNVMKLGPCLVSADAGIVAGDLVVTSGSVAGNVVTNNTASAGTIVGRAMESTGNTVAGQVYVDLGRN